jgi:hypothetical protein
MPRSTPHGGRLLADFQARVLPHSWLGLLKVRWKQSRIAPPIDKIYQIH